MAQTCEEMYSGLNRIVKCNEEYLAFGALAVALVALLLAIVVVRRPTQAVATVGRRIVDATKAGKLQVFVKKDFEEHLASSPFMNRIQFKAMSRNRG